MKSEFTRLISLDPSGDRILTFESSKLDPVAIDIAQEESRIVILCPCSDDAIYHYTLAADTWFAPQSELITDCDLRKEKKLCVSQSFIGSVSGNTKKVEVQNPSGTMRRSAIVHTHNKFDIGAQVFYEEAVRHGYSRCVDDTIRATHCTIYHSPAGIRPIDFVFTQSTGACLCYQINGLKHFDEKSVYYLSFLFAVQSPESPYTGVLQFYPNPNRSPRFFWLLYTQHGRRRL